MTIETARDVANYFWKSSGHILFAKDFGRDENFDEVSVGVDGSNEKDLTTCAGVGAEMVDDLRDGDAHILGQHNQRDKKVFDAYKIDVETGASEMVAKNPGNITSRVTDNPGKVRAAVSDRVNTRLL